jgi:hypothetical protein
VPDWTHSACRAKVEEFVHTTTFFKFVFCKAQWLPASAEETSLHFTSDYLTDGSQQLLAVINDPIDLLAS